MTGRQDGLKPMSKWHHMLSLPRLLTAIVFISIFALAVQAPADNDTWWHMATGRLILQRAELQFSDPFSHTRLGAPWINYSWLSDVLLYAVYALAGWAGLSLMVAGVVTLAFWLVYRQSADYPFLRAFGVIWGAITSSLVWAARPHLLCFVWIALVAYLLDRYKRHNGRLLPWLPLIMLVWANMHGGYYSVGLILMLCYLIGEALNRLSGHEVDPVLSAPRWRHLLLVTLLCILVIGINPNTWQLWAYPFRTVGIGVLRDFIQEWQSPDFHLIWQQPFLLLLFLIGLGLARCGRVADFTDLMLCLVWAAWALFAARNIAVFALVSVPILVRYLGLAWERQRLIWQQAGRFQTGLTRASRPLTPSNLTAACNGLLLIVVSLAALVRIVSTLTPAALDQAVHEHLPVKAVTYVQAQRPAGPLFNSYNWGGYIMFKLWPDYPVFVDGRTDLYEDAFLRQYLRIHLAEEGWSDLLLKYGIHLVLVESDSPLARALRQQPSWQEAYRDGVAAVFTRRAPV